MKKIQNKSKRRGFLSRLYAPFSAMDMVFEHFPFPLPAGTILFIFLLCLPLFGGFGLIGGFLFALPRILAHVIIYGGLFALCYLPIHYLVKHKFGYTIPVFPWIWEKIRNKQSGSLGSSVLGFKSNDLEFVINGRTTIKNPFAGIFISGGAGSGKSKSLIEPLIKEAGRKGYTGVVYDFKFPELAGYVNTAYQNSDIEPYFVNFTDLTRSHRINPISPELMSNDSYAREFAYSVLVNINPQMIKNSDFWNDTSVSLLASVFWYLKVQQPQYCTLPHAISMIVQPDIDALLATLSQVQKCKDMIAPVMSAYQLGAEKQLSGQIGTLQLSLDKINSDAIYYLMTSSSFSLELNNTDKKGMLVLGNDPTLSSTFSPIIGLILTSVSKQLNRQNKEKSVFMIDEFPTVYIPNVEQLPATARSNKVATILACQDIAQLQDRYGREKSESVLNNLGNQFYGRTPSIDTAKRVQALFGTYDKQTISESVGESVSHSYSERESNFVKLQDLANLNTGTFYTTLAEGKERQGVSAIPMDKRFVKTPIPVINKDISDRDIQSAVQQVKMDIEYILRKAKQERNVK